MNSVLRWISPFILALVTTTGIRLVTDLSTSYPFWERSAAVNLKDFLNSVLSCYLLDFIIRYFISKRILGQRKGLHVFYEYLFLALFIAVGSTLSTFVAHYFIDRENELVDFVIGYVVVIPIVLFYYTIIRNDKIKKDYDEQTLQLEKLKNEQLETELDFLKAQYQPHFLFNALNTVYFQVEEENRNAKETIELLSDLLRYQLYDVKQKVTIEQEINYMNSYIGFQLLRTSNRINLKADFDPHLKEQKIHPLLFQPLLENAFKYTGGDCKIDINLISEGNKILFTIENSIEDKIPDKVKKGGIGIENLKRRLELLYPQKHELITEKRKNSFYVRLIIDPE